MHERTVWARGARRGAARIVGKTTSGLEPREYPVAPLQRPQSEQLVCVELRAEPSDEVSNIAHSMYGWIMIKTIIVRTSASSMREESASYTETL